MTTHKSILYIAMSLDGYIAKPGKNIFIDGGAELVNNLMREDLIDEYIISVIPIFVGEGLHLFKDGRPEQELILFESKAFEKGLVQLHYKRTS